jgi:hypothetical protein
MKDPDELLVYLRYLRGRTDALSVLPELGEQEIGPLQGELRLFRDRVPRMEFVSASLKKPLLAVRLDIAARHLQGTPEYMRATWWFHLPVVKYWRADRRQRDKDVIDAELSALRADLHDLYRLVEVTFKRQSQPDRFARG